MGSVLVLYSVSEEAMETIFEMSAQEGLAVLLFLQTFIINLTANIYARVSRSEPCSPSSAQSFHVPKTLVRFKWLDLRST